MTQGAVKPLSELLWMFAQNAFAVHNLLIGVLNQKEQGTGTRKLHCGDPPISSLATSQLFLKQ